MQNKDYVYAFMLVYYCTTKKEIITTFCDYFFKNFVL